MEETMNKNEQEILTKILLNASMDELLWLRGEVRALILMKEAENNG